MRNTQMLFRVLFVLFTTSILICCSKDSDNDSNSVAPGSMSCTLDNDTWTTDDVGATIIQGRINVSGVHPDESNIVVSVNGDQEGTYIPDFQNHAVSYNVTLNGSTTVYTSQVASNNTTAEIVISEINTSEQTISGTFQSKVANNSSQELEIMDGQFKDIPYTTSTSPTNSTMTLKVDGQEWQPQSVNGWNAQNRIQLGGSNSDASRTVSLAFDENIQAGNHSISAFGIMATYTENTTDIYGNCMGTLTIDMHDKQNRRITGSFEYTATDFTQSKTFQITEGVFDITYL